jgi:hypothetical protein
MNRRGFALISVVLLTAMVAVAGAVLLDMVRLDILLGRSQRQTVDARELAEGAVMEFVNDLDTPEQLPMFDDNDLSIRYTPPTSSAFDRRKGEYTVDVALVRVVPLAESSAIQSRALVYEVDAVGAVGAGDAHFDVRTEIFRIVSYKPGTVLPRRHAR